MDLVNILMSYLPVAFVIMAVIALLILYVLYYKNLKYVGSGIESYNQLQVECDRLKKEIDDLSQYKKEILNEVSSLVVERQEIEDLRKKNEILQNKCLEQEKTLHDLEEQATEIRELIKQKIKIGAEINQLEIDKHKIEEYIAGYGDVKKEYEQAIQKIAEYEKNSIKINEITSKLQIIETKISEKSERLDYINKECATTEGNLEKVRNDLNSSRSELANNKAEVASLASEKVALEERIQELRGHLPGGNASDAYAELFDVEPAALTEKTLESRWNVSDEGRFFNGLKAYLEGKGLFFSDRVLAAFHTSLKCQDINPLTVLAGVSGTGKTQLPVSYAEYAGIHSLVIPVQPRWDSPQDLFGFYNYLEKKFQATDLSRSLVRMDPYNFNDKGFGWAHDRMLLVLLDEMNLARTEYYFSEFLSKLELRRQVGDPHNPYDRSKAEIALGGKYRLWVPDNVLFVGTMNEDESTQTLSDKVLDRSNVLRFGKPAEVGSYIPARKAAGPATGHLPVATWKSWISKPVGMDDSAIENCRKWIGMLNGAMEKIGRPFGYRVSEAMLRYVKCYPLRDRFQDAFADQIEQKILPKLRGVDTSQDGSESCLAGVGQVIEEVGDKELAKAFQQAFHEGRRYGLFSWRGVSRKLD